MKFLIATNDTHYLDESTSIIEKELPKIKHIQDAIDQSDLFKKVSQARYEYILIDLKSCPIDIRFFEKLVKLKSTKVKISCKNYADLLNEFFNQKSIQLSNMDYSLLSQGLEKLILNDKDFFWGEGIKQLTLYDKETLCHEGSIGDAIYLIKEGLLQREFPDGRILDGSIGAGKMVGELSYFSREPRTWKVVAVGNCTLIRISYDKVDSQLKNQAGWIKVMFTSLAERSLKYAKSS